MKTWLATLATLVVLVFVCTGCYDVLYTVEWKGDSCIKFEDALFDQDPDELVEDWVDACLGEDGVEEADYFAVELDGYTEDIDVTIKAGKCKETVTLVWDDVEQAWMGEACGFTILASWDSDYSTYHFLVVSDMDNRTAALSNVTFCFGDGVTVVSPAEGSYTVERLSDYDEPTEPDEEE